jgi:hypothetical protein
MAHRLQIVSADGRLLARSDRPAGDDLARRSRQVRPPPHGPWLAGHLAEARPELLAEHGHLSIVIGSYGCVLNELIASAD